MEANKGRGKKPNLIVKTWERCKSIGRSPKGAAAAARERRRCVIAPVGCFSVYVGQQRQRFVIRAEYANHPLFRVLLEEAESEFGFSSDGPLVLPCDIALFRKVLVAMDDCGGGDDDGEMIQPLGCGGSGRGGFVRGCSPYRFLSPPRMVAINQF